MNTHYFIRNKVLRYNPRRSIVSSGRAEQICRKLNILDEVRSKTSYLPDGKFTRRIFHIINSLDHIPKCSYDQCNNDRVFLEFARGYQPFCSRRCRILNNLKSCS